MKTRFTYAGAGLLLGALAVYMCLHYGRVGDYYRDAGPALDALRVHDWHGFLANSAVMGPATLLLRAPFALLTPDAASQLAVYRVGSIPCVLAASLLGLVVAIQMRRRGQPVLLCGLVAALFVANPIVVKALQFGHPEEIFGAALSVLAMLAALSRRWLAAAICVGLALATKQWAVVLLAPIALAVVLCGLPRWRSLAVAAAAGVVLTLPFFVAGPGALVESQRDLSQAKTEHWHPASPYSVWYEFLPVRTFHIKPVDGVSVIRVHQAVPLSGTIGRGLIVLLPFVVVIPLLHGRQRLNLTDPLLFLAFVFLLRCILDPLNNPYYHLPLLFALLAWESLTIRGIPIVSVFVAVVWLFYPVIASGTWASYPLHTELYLIWALPLGTWMALRLYFPDLNNRLGRYLSARGFSPRARLAGGGSAETRPPSPTAEPYASRH